MKNLFEKKSNNCHIRYLEIWYLNNQERITYCKWPYSFFLVPSENNQEVYNDFSVCLLNLLLEVSTLPGLVAIN